MKIYKCLEQFIKYNMNNQNNQNNEITRNTDFDFKIKIENKDIDVLQKIIIQCCEIKSDIVSEDENENELRMILNFGHTVGHAIESFTNYKNLLH